MTETTVTELSKAIMLILGGGGVGALFTWLNNRDKIRAYTLGVVDKSVQAAMESVTNEVLRLNAEQAELRAQHRQCEKDLASIRNEIRSFKPREEY